MTAITITDLNNAKVDVDHIADVANSDALEATDRMGNTKPTLAGLRSRYPLGYAKSYANTTQGLAGTTNGEQFLVRTADEYTFQNYYNNGGVATLIGTLSLASGERYTQAIGSAVHHAFTDSDGLALVTVEDDGIHDRTSGSDVLLTGAPDELEAGSGTGTFAMQDSRERVLMAQDNKGRWALHGLGYVFDNIAANDIGTAIVYEQFGNTAYKYFLADRSRSRLGHRVHIHKNLVPSNADGTSFARFPFYVPISDTAGLLLFGQRHASIGDGEEKVRQVCKSVTINKDAGTLTAGPTVVIAQSAKWTAGTGGNTAGGVGVRIPAGVHAGRIVVVYNKLISANELYTDGSYERALHTRYSDDGGVTWSAEVKVMGAAQIYDVNTGGVGGVPGGVPTRNGCMTGTANCIVRIPSGPYAGRIVCSLYTTQVPAYIGSMYSDDDGVTWTRGTLQSSPGGRAYNESALTYCSDGSLFLLNRCEDIVGGVLVTGSGRSISNDGGATWTYQGHVATGFGNASHSLLNASLAAATGFEKQLAACTEDTRPTIRQKHSLKLSYDKGATWVGEVKFFSDLQGIGYGCLQRLSGGDYVFVYETFNNTGGINTADTIGMIYFNEAELMAQAALI